MVLLTRCAHFHHSITPILYSSSFVVLYWLQTRAWSTTSSTTNLLASMACLLLRMVAAITTPCSVKTHGAYCLPPLPGFVVTICDLKDSRFFSVAFFADEVGGLAIFQFLWIACGGKRVNVFRVNDCEYLEGQFLSFASSDGLKTVLRLELWSCG